MCMDKSHNNYRMNLHNVNHTACMLAILSELIKYKIHQLLNLVGFFPMDG